MPPLAAEHSNRELRGRLSQITQRPLETQEPLIRDLQPTYRHSISLDEPAKKPSYNCVQYAFDLVDLPNDIRETVDELERWRRQRQLPRISPLDTTFVNFLIERGVLDEPSCAESEDVVVYLKNKTVKHAGKIQGEFVHSKWSYLGHLWQHGIWEVPIGYGDDVLFFKHIARDDIFQRLSAFIEDIRNADNKRKQNQLLASLHHPWP
ncbi:MAG: hypothetical protein Q8R91_07945 [Candidatus Omnitrophota bacterium]|nr:hypothetical protein [Candidatus Omnitrophota bacterium]